jgi:hypothetical protein
MLRYLAHWRIVFFLTTALLIGGAGSTNAADCFPDLFCIMVYDPVCGSDGRTYSNACMAERACVEVDYEGVCSRPPSSCQDLDQDGYSPEGGDCGAVDCNDRDPVINPDMVCAAIYDPVCGVDGNTYSNSCDALRNCVEIDYTGECSISTTSCTDADGDGYSPEGGDCGRVDCNDNDDTISPEIMCFDNYDPVLGTDGKIYSNACYAKQACALED